VCSARRKARRRVHNAANNQSMLVRILIIILLSTAAAAARPAGSATDPAAQLSVSLVGVGSKTCSDWLSSPSHKLEGAVWIYGFWSGLNYVAAASEQKQSRASSADIVSAVEKVCRRGPSQLLASAAWSAYVGHNAAQGAR
jgi:hypothetical protein